MTSPQLQSVAPSLESGASSSGEATAEVTAQGGVPTRKPQASSAAQRRKRAAAIHRWTRFGIQIVFFILAPGLFTGAFNGVKYLLSQVGAGAPVEFTSFLVLLVALLAFTVVFGRFFCGYACAFGTLGDVLYGAFDFIRSKTPLPRIVFPDRLVKALSLLKYLVLIGVCVACFFGVWSSVSGLSPWVAFAGLTNGSLDNVDVVAVALLAILAVCMALRERFFCQFLCPLGAVFSLMPVLGFSEFSRTRGHCARNCGRCREGCPVGIWPDTDEIGHGECIACGRCSVSCPMSNVNLVAVERKPRTDAVPSRPLRKTRDGWRLLKGTETWVVLVKAVALLALCWVVGATRYLPPFQGLS